MRTRLITAPVATAVSLEEAKLHLRVTHNAEDSLITALIKTATGRCEHLIGRAIMPQTWELILDDAFPTNGDIELLHPPVQSITSVKYIDAVTANEVTLANNQYSLDKDSEPGWLMPAYGVEWPSTLKVANAIRVRYVAGYADAASVPDVIKQWMLLTIGTYYANRESVVVGSITQSFDRGTYDGLLDSVKVWSL